MMSAHRALSLPILFPAPNRLALVMAMFTAGQSQFDLGATSHEVHGEGDERQPLFGDSPVEAIDFASVEQELPTPLGITRIGARGRLIG